MAIHRVTITNTEDLPVTNFPVSLVFEEADDDFYVLAVGSGTIPKEEFGEIEYSTKGREKLRFVYSLLNPRDLAQITLLTSKKKELNVYGKGKGVSFNTNKEKSTDELSHVRVFVIAAFGALIAVLMLWGLFKITKGRRTNI